MRKNQTFKKGVIFFQYFLRRKNEVLGHKSVFFLKEENIFMKYIGQCLEKFLYHTNMPNLNLLSLDGNTAL